jgi:lysozyme family protein
MSFAVNDNIKIAVQTLQTILGVHVDGAIGPITIAEANSKDPVIVAKLFRAEWSDFYTRDAQLNPNKAKFLEGWQNRTRLAYP